jgi:hypothetical protein
MGKWMLAFCVFWAYIGFGQYMLIWYANIPEETAYFIRRNVESWNVLSTLLVVGRFFVAFGILLLQGPKKHPHRLCLIAGWIVLMQALDMYIVVLPSLHGAGVQVSIWDFVPLLAIGSTLAFAYLRIVGKSSLFPNRAPAGHLTLTTYIGGERYPELATLPMDKLVELTCEDLKVLLGVRGKPTFQHTVLYSKAIPQYNVGFGKYREAMTELEQRMPGVYLAGHYRDGVSLGDSIVSGCNIAERVKNASRAGKAATEKSIAA